MQVLLCAAAVKKKATATTFTRVTDCSNDERVCRGHCSRCGRRLAVSAAFASAAFFFTAAAPASAADFSAGPPSSVSVLPLLYTHPAGYSVLPFNPVYTSGGAIHCRICAPGSAACARPCPCVQVVGAAKHG